MHPGRKEKGRINAPSDVSRCARGQRAGRLSLRTSLQCWAASSNCSSLRQQAAQLSSTPLRSASRRSR